MFTYFLHWFLQDRFIVYAGANLFFSLQIGFLFILVISPYGNLQATSSLVRVAGPKPYFIRPFLYISTCLQQGKERRPPNYCIISHHLWPTATPAMKLQKQRWRKLSRAPAPLLSSLAFASICCWRKEFVLLILLAHEKASSSPPPPIKPESYQEILNLTWFAKCHLSQLRETWASSQSRDEAAVPLHLCGFLALHWALLSSLLLPLGLNSQLDKRKHGKTEKPHVLSSGGGK